MPFIRTKNISFAVDDFGISPTANARMLELALAHRVDRVAVMTEGFLPSDDIRQLLTSGVALDIHLEIHNPLRTGERKLSDGALGRIVTFLRGYLSGKIGARSIERQWEAQILHFQQLFGRLPDGLNSHEHTHFFPPYFHTLLRLAERHRIPYIRFGTSLNREFVTVSIILNCLRWLNRVFFRRAARPQSQKASFSIMTSDYLISFDWLHSLEAIHTYPPKKTIELIFHPERDEEMELLKSLQ